MEKVYRIADLPIPTGAFDALPIVRGCVEGVTPRPESNLEVSGWLLLPETSLERIDVYLDGNRVAAIPLTQRQDVADVFPWIPHANRCGFRVVLPLSQTQRTGTSMLEIIAFNGDTPTGRLSQFVRADVDRLPSPPEEYIFRVMHTRSQHFFKVGGLKVFGEFMEAVRRHGGLSGTKRILDWGCGCGRVTAHFMSITDGPEVFGCDIDPFAVEWSNKNLQKGAFAVLGPLPPTPYPDAHFDLIVSYSVFTHLTREVQGAWLQEMHRLLSPGGRFVATTHGEFAFSFAKRLLDAEFPLSGIEDSFKDATMEGIAPKDYYRATYQAREYTVREFGRCFQVLEYVDRGAANFQDLIVLGKQ